MMNTMNTGMVTEFPNVLTASARSPEIPESEDVYGWLVGDWELVVCHYLGMDVTSRVVRGEVHAGWVLQGRAVQDVWLYPSDPQAAELDKMITYGTTLRVWDPAIKAWRITWINPARNHREEQIGRRMGNDIVQIGFRANGQPTRWRFTEITPDSFHWLGDALQPDGQTWQLEAEFRATRMTGKAGKD
jgi:hypothetical protein